MNGENVGAGPGRTGELVHDRSGELQHAHYPLMAAPIQARPQNKKETEAAPAKREREGESSVTKGSDTVGRRGWEKKGVKANLLDVVKALQRSLLWIHLRSRRGGFGANKLTVP